MHRNLKWLFMALLLAGALLGYGLVSNSARSDDPVRHAEDMQAIKQAAAAYSAAFEKGDVDRLLSYWSPDAEFIDESGKMTQGRNAIAAMLRKSQASLKGYKLKLEGSQLRFVTADVAMVDGKATLVSPEGTEVATPFAAVWVKSGGKWLVRSLRDLEENKEQEAVTPADHLKPLVPLLGDWVSTGKGMDVQLHCSWTLKKSFLLMEYTIKDRRPRIVDRSAVWLGPRQPAHSLLVFRLGRRLRGSHLEPDGGWVGWRGRRSASARQDWKRDLPTAYRRRVVRR